MTDNPSAPSSPQPQSSIVVAELVEQQSATIAVGVDSEADSLPLGDTASNESELQTPQDRSWVFRCFDWTMRQVGHAFGILSVLILLAVTASIPIVQFVSFGYLLEVSGRLARGNSFADAMVGLRKARVVGGIILGVWICLLPVRLVSNFWFEAYLIDPASNQTIAMRIAQLVLMALTLAHIAAALLCGGKLRYFFWPLVAPVSLAVWSLRKLAGVSFFRRTLGWTTGWISPRLADDLCRTKPVRDWFLPAIVWRRLRAGGLYQKLRDQVWDFAVGLRPGHFFSLGAKGFLGSFIWLFVPTSFLVVSSFSEGGVALLTFLAGVLFAIPIFAGLPFLQAHFARDGKLLRFAEIRTVFANFARAPLAHVMTLLIMLVLALPLFLFKIEDIPSELLWTLSLVFVAFSWPARLAIGWAYRRGQRRQHPARWWVRYPLFLTTLPITFAFVMIFTTTRYVSWHGAFSLFENHVFLLPAPFWI